MYRVQVGEVRNLQDLSDAMDEVESYYGVRLSLRVKHRASTPTKVSIGLETSPLDDLGDPLRTTVIWNSYRANKAFISVNEYAMLLSQVEEHLAWVPHFCGEGSEGATHTRAEKMELD